MKRSAKVCWLLFVLVPWSPVARGADKPAVRFSSEEGKLHISVGGQPFATYAYQDAQVLRPYFAHVRAPGGAQVTRNHPPIEGRDATDHAAMHPGLWLAFGDLGGADFWRNKAAARHVEFVEKPQGGAGAGTFAVKNRYQAGDKVICEETCRIAILARSAGHLLLWDSAFGGGDDFAFGDQEEMGLGLRVAAPLTVKNGGRITNSAGQTNERQVWGRQADWCAYGGEVGGRRVGVVLLSDPRNFRRPWFHARDYGLLVANPFGQKAFTKGEPSTVVVKKGEAFRLRFGVLVYAGEFDGSAAYRDYLEAAGVKQQLDGKK